MRAVKKDFVREIRKSRSRFFSIMILVALAVAFLAGLRATAPDMKRTGDLYLDRQHLQDVQVLSTLGITEDDVAELSRRSEVALAVGGYRADAWANGTVTAVCSLTEGVNVPEVTSGRLPEKADECVVDARLLAEGKLSLGDTLTLTPDEDAEDTFRFSDFTVVGTVRSPYYISVERGSASIGSGTAEAYLYLLPEAFSMDCYTVCYLLLNGAEEKTAFYPEYDDFVDDAIDGMEDFGKARAKKRHDDLVSDATEKLDDAEAELSDAKREAEAKLRDAEAELSDARQEIDDGWQEYYDGEAELTDAEAKLADAETELADALAELNDGEREYEDGLAAYEDGEREYEDGVRMLDRSRDRVFDGYATLNEQLTLLGLHSSMLDEETLTLAIETKRQELLTLAGAIGQISLMPDGMPGKEEAVAALEAQLSAVGLWQGDLASTAAAVDAAIAALDEIDCDAILSAKSQLDYASGEIRDGSAELREARRELDEAKKELRDAREKLDDGWQEYRDGVRDFEDGYQEYADGKEELSDAFTELTDAEAEYRDGYDEYLDGKAEANRKIADAEAELRDARRKVSEIESGEWYILSRSADPGYTGFGEDADRMANLANVFPMIFFLVAALVCLTTMTRMVDEERTQIGLMKAMGYRRFSISRKYLSYGLLPSLFGSVFGLLLGYLLFPTMIYTAYQLMYEMPDISLAQYTDISLFSSLFAVACTTVSTLFACLATLRDNPANLMRPRAPKAGKRVLLERIGFLWRRFPFHWKVTIRNLFRYKKRFLMTVIGIGGCTALMMVGFGIRHSITAALNIQYDELSLYDAQVVLEKSILPEDRADLLSYLDENAERYAELYATSLTAEGERKSQTAYLEVLDAGETDGLLLLRDYDTKEPLSLPESGVLIDKKLAELLQIGVGDTFTLSSDGRYRATVAGVYENYLSHFIYVTPDAYAEIFGVPAADNSLLFTVPDGDEAVCRRVIETLLTMDGVSSVSRSGEARDTVENRMASIDFVVVIVILCAAALAVVVLYNLSSINITERKREMATLKVLGFHDTEVTAYVVRENVILTLIGVALGCLMGRALHRWLILSVEIDLMMFGRSLNANSYIWSSLLTVLFSALVNVMAHRRMKEIDMVESLKSAE